MSDAYSFLVDCLENRAEQSAESIEEILADYTDQELADEIIAYTDWDPSREAELVAAVTKYRTTTGVPDVRQEPD